MTRAAGRPRHRWPLTVARVLADVALLVMIGVGLSGVVLGRVLPAMGHPVFVVAGPSMVPAIGVGAAVILDDVVPSALAVGDVVTLRSGPGRAVFTHRIVRIVERDGQPWIETRGDANPGPDPSITPASAVIGRAALQVPAGGYLLTLLSAPAGVLLVLSVGATLMLLGWLLESLDIERRRRAATIASTSSPVTITPSVVTAMAGAAAPEAAATSAPAPKGPGVGSRRAPDGAPAGAHPRRAARGAPRLTPDTMESERRRLVRLRASSRGT